MSFTHNRAFSVTTIMMAILAAVTIIWGNGRSRVAALTNVWIGGCEASSEHRSGMETQAASYFKREPDLRMAHAIENGYTQEITNLVSSKAVDPNGFGQEPTSEVASVSFLEYAVQVDNKASVEALIRNGADVNKRTPDRWSPMAEAARSFDRSMIPLLIAAGGDIHVRGNTEQPLTFIAYGIHHFDTMNLLLDRGVDVNGQDATGNTLLAFMASNLDYEHMLALLTRGADPKIGKRGNTYLVAWTVQNASGRLKPAMEALRQQVIREFERRGISFPVPPPSRWDPQQHKYVQS